MSHVFDPSILRQYDIRGVVDDTLHEADARALGRAFATMASDRGLSKIAVGRDGRDHSQRLQDALIDGLRVCGMDVVNVGMGPSPMLYYAAAELDVDGGIQVTGSHNPGDYNGFKMLLGDGSVHGEAIQELGRIAASGEWSEGAGSLKSKDVLKAYVKRLTKDFRGGEFRIGWDAGNGAAGPALEMLVKALPGEHHTLYTEVDGSFPNHHPDPTVEKNLDDLKALVAEKGLDFGIAFDGDGDRIGAVDGKGRVIWGDQILMLLARPVLAENPGATIIADVKASKALFDRIESMGGDPVMWKTGHSLIKAKMKETGAPLAGEMSGHIFFKHRWYGFDDALYAAVRLIEAVGQAGMSLSSLYDNFPETVATPEMRFPVDGKDKFAVIDQLLDNLRAAGADINDTDGARVTTEDGWWLLRASNTQDVLAARAEASDEEGLDRLVAQIDAELGKLGISRS
ncbi:phosphoglucomutase/phosphomannomutase PgmG [Sphingomicrobium sediminis]|uniref:Phosphomannomutase/phosphoglucomutase n=1 Tax=Sphingomicrobium sediminis TaxID=2950949 RepID=A0A9X2J341_9SPHN|nr:phosphomannomutase/phosphoglucomutase [Sphingomicrobium sediminis]MCM8558414.1 phosphomannomutase/phosphoglucomutase [Sphingomicrobium sediminis]